MRRSLRHPFRGATALVVLASSIGLGGTLASAAGRSVVSVPAPYVVSFVATAATAVDMNDAGTVIGTSQPDPGCGSSCLPPEETVVWRRGRRIVLQSPVAAPTPIVLSDINDRGWITGSVGYPESTARAVVWKPTRSGYEAIDLGTLPGRTTSTAIGLDDRNRVVGWSTSTQGPPDGAPFLWTKARGMVDLTTRGAPGEQPRGISPDGTVATDASWFDLDEPGIVHTLAPPPRGFRLEASRVAVNDAGDQARFLVTRSGQPLDYPFRYHHEGGGTWQQLSTIPTGHLSSYGVGSIDDAGDVTLTVKDEGMVAFGPDGLARSLAPLVSPAYGESVPTAARSMNTSGQILAEMIIGQSGRRVVRLTPSAPCTANCMRVRAIRMRGTGPDSCHGGTIEARATVTVTDASGHRLRGVRVGGHFLDDYWLDQVVAGRTNAQGRATFEHSGPACVGAIAFLVTDAARTDLNFDRTTGTLTDSVIPKPD